MTNPKHTDTSRSGELVGDDFAPIWDESLLLAEHEAVQASVGIGGWLSAALDDPKVCDAMKTDINSWFSAGFLYLDEVRKLMQTEREALEAENERLRSAMVVMDNTVRELTEALREMFEAVCGETGFAQAVRAESGIAYPWPALDLAEAMARAALGEKQ